MRVPARKGRFARLLDSRFAAKRNLGGLDFRALEFLKQGGDAVYALPNLALG